MTRVDPNRRDWLRWAGAAGLAGVPPIGCGTRREPADVADEPTLARFPEKVALRVINDRPPCLETPWRYFRDDLTPNEAFYVRWHLQAIPTTIDARAWRLKVGGHVERACMFSLDDLRRMEAVSVVAVNQCSGNSRGLFAPRVPGSQWGNGAMGNARWTGVRLADLLHRAGARSGAIGVTVNGLDVGPLPGVPDYIKALDIDHALGPDVLVAYEMNGDSLPMLNGFPARLVVPGWYATYWVKALSEINVVTENFPNFWMDKAYRIPKNPGADESPGALSKETIPIHRMNVRSFFVHPEPGERIAAGRPCALEGIAFDGGRGIRRVEVSTDGGARWTEARLDRDLGRFSFRRWRLTWTPEARGAARLMVRAVNRDGESMPAQPRWNRSGYMRNVVEDVAVMVV